MLLSNLKHIKPFFLKNSINIKPLRNIYTFFTPNCGKYLLQDPTLTISEFPSKIESMKLSESLILLHITNKKVHSEENKSGISDLQIPFKEMIPKIENYFWPKIDKMSAEAFAIWLQANAVNIISEHNCKLAIDRLITFIHEDMKHSSLIVKDGKITKVNKRILEPRVFTKIIKSFYYTLLNFDGVSVSQFQKLALEYIENNMDDFSVND